MEQKLLNPNSVWPAIVIGIFLFVMGFYSLNHLTSNIWPINPERIDLLRDVALDRADPTRLMQASRPTVIVAFLLSLTITVIGMTLPFIQMTNRRFRGRSFASLQIAFRQASFLGIWTAVSVWMGMNRVFGLAIGLLIAGILILFEIVLQIRAHTEVEVKKVSEQG